MQQLQQRPSLRGSSSSSSLQQPRSCSAKAICSKVHSRIATSSSSGSSSISSRSGFAAAGQSSVAPRSLATRTRAAADGDAPSAPLTPESVVKDEFFEVEKLLGVRASLEGEDPVVEYRVKWKDGRPDTWELATNISPDLVREFDDRWWASARKGDEPAMREMLKFSRDLLPQVVDDNGRSALHFAAAVNSVPCVQLLLAAGADADLQDREGYTPLHMAAGYSQTASMMALLEGGADPLLRDSKGQDVPLLIEGLRGKMPPVAAMLQRRMALEQVAAVLTRRLYDEVDVARVLDARPASEGAAADGAAAADGSGEREFLVAFRDGAPDAWLPERDVAADLVEDWDAGMERAEVAEVVDLVQWGTERQFLVRWADGAKDSWEPEEAVPAELVEALRRAKPALFKGVKGSGGGAGRRGGGSGGNMGRRRRRGGGGSGGGGGDGGGSGGKKQQQQQQHQAAASAAEQPGSGSQAAAAANGHAASAAAAATPEQQQQQAAADRERVAVA